MQLGGNVSVVVVGSGWGTLARPAPGPGEIIMTGVAQMVAAVLRRIGAGTPAARRIAVLSIRDHGTPRSFNMGEDQVTLASLPQKAAEFARLRPHFAPGAMVRLGHPGIARQPALLQGLALLLAVPVLADDGAEAWPAGAVPVRAHPDGRVVADGATAGAVWRPMPAWA